MLASYISRQAVEQPVVYVSEFEADRILQTLKLGIKKCQNQLKEPSMLRVQANSNRLRPEEGSLVGANINMIWDT